MSDQRTHAIEELLTDYAVARSAVIAEMASSITTGYRFLAHDIRDRCQRLEVEWRVTLLPMHVREAFTYEPDPREGKTVIDTVGEPHPFDPMFCGAGCQEVEET